MWGFFLIVIYYHYFPCSILCQLALTLSPQTCRKNLSAPALHPPVRQLKTAIRCVFSRLILRLNKPSFPSLSWHIWCSRAPSPAQYQCIACPYTSPRCHTSILHQKMVFFATCLKQEGLHLGVSLLLLSFSLRLCVHKHLQAICCKHKVRPSLMKDDFLQYLHDYMNCAGHQPANLSPLHRNITRLAATALLN